MPAVAVSARLPAVVGTCPDWLAARMLGRCVSSLVAGGSSPVNHQSFIFNRKPGSGTSGWPRHAALAFVELVVHSCLNNCIFSE